MPILYGQCFQNTYSHATLGETDTFFHAIALIALSQQWLQALREMPPKTDNFGRFRMSAENYHMIVNI